MEKIELLKEILNADSPKERAAALMSELSNEEREKATFNSRIEELNSSNPVDVFVKYHRDKRQAYAVTEVYSAAAAWRDILGWRPDFGVSSYVPYLISNGEIRVHRLRIRDFLSFPTEKIAIAFAEKYKEEMKLIDKLKE